MKPSSPSRESSTAATSTAPGGDARLAPVLERLRDDDGLRVLSLDVFDTLLFRRLPMPDDLFALLGARLRGRGALATGVSDELFATLRAAAEAHARERVRAAGGGVEVTLEEIHRALPESLFARPVELAELAEVECAVERELLVPDLDVLELIETAHGRGRRVIAVSDTYFSERQLRLFMARGPLDPGCIERIFASSHHRTGKGTGLWSIVLSQVGCAPGEILHVGDNHLADVVAPSRLGIQTAFFERRPPALRRLLEREEIVHRAALHPAHGDHGLSALRAKVLARVEGSRQPEGLWPFWAFGAGALGPAFAGFAEWVHAEAAAAGASKAFCLMREGALLASLIDDSRPAAGGVRAEPLWLSRQVCARAMIAEGTREELEALWMRRRLPTLREYLAALGLSLEDLPALAARAETRMEDAGFGDEVVDAILSDSALRTRVVAQSRQLRRRIVRYLEGLRPPGEERLVVVDLGWQGTIQHTLERILREAGVDWRTLGLYVVTGPQIAPRLLEGTDARGFLASAGVPDAPVSALMRSPEILEQVCMPDHGSQTDLTEDLRPVLAAADDLPMQSVQRAAVQQGIATFAREWRRYRETVPGGLPALADGGRDRLLAQLTRAVVAPTADEAALFSGWLHDENFGSDQVDSIADPGSTRALRYLEPRELAEIPMTELYWPYGLAALHDEPLASSVAAVAGGVLPWEAFSSELETGPFELFADLGWGFAPPPTASLDVRRNRRGLCLAKTRVRGDFVQRLRLAPVHDACVLRIDWITLRCRMHGRADPVTVSLESPRELASLKLRGCHLIGDKLLMVPGRGASIDVEVERLAAGRVYFLDFECAYAVLPLARSAARERWGRLKAQSRRVAKETWLGAPLRLGWRVARRLRA